MQNLNSDIVLEILSRLPKTNTGFKSVLHCREVCRLWRNLLGKPKKGMLFVTRPKYDHQLKLYYRDKPSEMVNSGCTEEPHNFYKMVTEISTIDTGYWSSMFVGTCNGLVCYVISNYIILLTYIYNPITGESIRLPNMSSGYDVGPIGFGYCSSTKTYKVVKIGQTYANFMARVQVYTLGDGSGWRDKPEVTYTLWGSGVFANGALHWLLNKRSSSSNCDIVAFDLADETFRCLPSPPCQPKYDKNVNLGSCGANLYLCHSYIKQGEGTMDIWVFEKKNMRNCRRSLEECTYFNSFTWIRRFSRKWDEGSTRLLSLTESEILLLHDNVLSCYDSTTLKKIWSAEAADAAVCLAIPHMHTLVSLKDLGEERVELRKMIPRHN